MGVAEKAEGRLEDVEGVGGVAVAEDVIVLVERRAVADRDGVVDDLRALPEPGEEVQVFPGDGLLGPEMAAAAIGLKVWIESRPETALSWLPRMIVMGRRVRILWMTSLGEAP